MRRRPSTSTAAPRTAKAAAHQRTRPNSQEQIVRRRAKQHQPVQPPNPLTHPPRTAMSPPAAARAAAQAAATAAARNTAAAAAAGGAGAGAGGSRGGSGGGKRALPPKWKPMLWAIGFGSVIFTGTIYGAGLKTRREWESVCVLLIYLINLFFPPLPSFVFLSLSYCLPSGLFPLTPARPYSRVKPSKKRENE